MSDSPSRSKSKTRTLRTILRGSLLLGLFFVLYFPFGNQPSTRGQLLPVDGGGTGGFVAKWVQPAGNTAPIATAGISTDTNVGRSYASSFDVKAGTPTPLYFSAFLGTKASPSSQSSDPDGWTDANGVSTGGHCDWNIELRQSAPPAYPDNSIPSPAAATACETSRSSPTTNPYTFNDLPESDAQISRTFTYNVLRITDNKGVVSNDGQIPVSVHYQPTASIAVNGSAVATINSGGSATIVWSSTHASACTGTGFDTGGAVSGTKTVSPSGNTTYSVSCSGSPLWSPGSASAQVLINGPAADIKANGSDGPITIPPDGSPVTLTWTSANATSCAGTGFNTSGATSNQTGVVVHPTVGTAYTLSCTGDSGNASDSVIVNVNNILPTAVAGASLDTASSRTYSNTIVVTQGIPVKVYLSANGSSDSDGTITSCQWNSDLSQDPPIRFDRNVSVSPLTPISSQCDTTISSLTFPLPSEDQSVLGDHTYQALTVTDDKNGISAPASIHVLILPQLAVALSASPTAGDAPFSPTLAAAITKYTGPKSDTGNFSFWWDCPNTSNDLGVVAAVCGTLPTDSSSGDRACATNQSGAKCDGVPLQGFENLSVAVDPAYASRAAAYTPKVIVERGGAMRAEDRTSVTSGVGFDYSLSNSGDVTIVPGQSGSATIVLDHTAGANQRVSLSASGLPAGVTASLTPASCDDSCTSQIVLNVGSGVAAGTYPVKITGSLLGRTTSFNLNVLGTLTCGPASQSVIVNTPISQLTAQGGTGSYAWLAQDPADPRLPDPNANPNTGAGVNFVTTYATTGARIVKVTSGSQSATCSVAVVTQTLGAAISAVPDQGTAPLSSRITGAITPGSTAVGTLNYSFWWDCPNDGSNVSQVINGTNGKQACGDPQGTASLATNYPEVTCLSGDTGAKCFVDPAGVAGFNPVNNPLQLMHTYAARASAYSPKVIIERGLAPAAQDIYAPGVTVAFPGLTLSCTASPASVITGQNVTWSATASGGSGTYSYVWNGDGALQNKTSQSVTVVYTSAGSKSGGVTLTDTNSGATKSASCGPVNVSLPANGQPVAIAGISKDTSSSRRYASAVDVKFGTPTPLYFSAFIGTKVSPSAGQISDDPDGWISPEGVSSGGHCDWNIELRTTANPYQDNRITSPAAATSCETSRSNPVSSPYTFNDLPQSDAQISRSLTYNILQITDNRSTVSNDGQASVVVHYQPTATITANGQSAIVVNSGEPVTIAWSSTHADSCTGVGFDTGGSVAGVNTLTPASDTTYSVICIGSPLWTSATARASVSINAPSVDLKANGSNGPISVPAGSAVKLTWVSTNASSCAGTGFNTNGAVQSPAAGVMVTLTRATTYGITCQGTGDRTATDSVSADVNFAFSLSHDRDISVVQGATAGNTTIITVTRTGGTGQSVSLSAQGLPAGASAVFTPSSCNPGTGSCTSTLAITTTRGAGATPAGSFPITIVGTAGNTTVTQVLHVMSGD